MMEKPYPTQSLIMILLMLLLTAAAAESGHTHSVRGQEINGACVCEVNSTVWAFPAAKYDAVEELVKNCQDSLGKLQTQTVTSEKTVLQINATLNSVTRRLERFQYLNEQGLYNMLHLKQLSQEIQQLHDTMNTEDLDRDGEEAQRIRTELQKFQKDVDEMFNKDVLNLEATREKLRSLSNRVQTCRTFPRVFRSNCSEGTMTNIGEPVVFKLNPFSKSYIAGAWGHDIDADGEETYWIQPLANGNRLGITVRFYKTYEDFMAARNHRDETLVGSYTHANAIQGPGTIVHKGVVYYQCYNVPELCAYDVKTKQVRRLGLPGAGFNNKFPYCYIGCLDWTDISLSANDKGLWVMYATDADHGNMVVSRVDTENFNVTHTWKTRLFKRSVTNAFMVCGVLYATRYINTYKEELFYAFDTTTGMEDNTLSIPMEKVAAGVANLHYNPTDKRLYMYNGGYMLAYQAYF
ncbi:olfactomedin-like isoform X2 [Tachysurus fulvidraco]|uniref:olfactomedin-like isoform X2 n=1 Tax=Tachysurus fulvidraco TaxID=1234273 RepID=UPI001FEE736F|nr:olfactomedin-like isoform X2 [Tachysurus fulvidraco]